MFVYYNTCIKNSRSFGGAFMRIKNLKRFIISMTILFTIISFLCSLLTNKVFSYTVPEYEKIVVSKGDTLWSIASELNGDIRENIYEIKKRNNLKTSYIYEGQELQLPIK